MKRHWAVLALLVFAGSSASGGSLRTIEHDVFRTGEHFVFDVDWGLINAGRATMSIPGTLTYKDRTCQRILTTASSNAFFTTFYRVRDTVESYMDSAGLFSWRFVKHLEEGKWWNDQRIYYDQEEHVAYYHETRRKKKPRIDTLAIPPFVQDILSVFYYVRTLDLKVGKSYEVVTQADRKVYPLVVHVYKKQTIKVPAGKFKCLKIEPVLKSAGIFKQKGRLWVWLTDDKKRMPVLMKSKIAVGSISTRLRKYTLN